MEMFETPSNQTWAGKLVWDWSGEPELKPSGASRPIGEELTETAGKLPGCRDLGGLNISV